jgi:hypothetical protein
MALPASGAISFNAINVELGVAGTTSANINQASYRTLAGVPSGTISLSNFYGKANAFSGTISSNQTNLNLRTWALANGWGGTSAATITVGSSVYVYSTSTGTPGLTIDGAWPGGVTLVNNGFVMGMGGSGGQSNGPNSIDGNPGGTAISLGVSCSITNNSYIGGGGGGGGTLVGGCGGGGAGGGEGGTASGLTTIPTFSPVPGGAGGGPGSSGGDGSSYLFNNGKYPFPNGTGGGGGRIMPGTGGVGGNVPSSGSGRGGKGGGSGGGGGADGQFTTATAGDGGSGGASGGNAVSGRYSGGGGGGWGASGGQNPGGFPVPIGGSGGKAIALNGYTATRTGGGTTYGSVS